MHIGEWMQTWMHVFYVFYVPKVLYVFLCFPRSLRFLGGNAKRRVDANPGCTFSTRFLRIARLLRIIPETMKNATGMQNGAWMQIPDACKKTRSQRRLRYRRLRGCKTAGG